MTAHSLFLVLIHDRSLPWPGSYTLLLTLLAGLLSITAHYLCLALIHHCSLLACLLYMTAHSLVLAIKHDRLLSWARSYT